jgi:dienelactone hydrolase
MSKLTTCTLLVTLLALGTAAAQDKGKKDERKPGDELIEKYLAAEADKLSQKFMDGAKTYDEWQKKRPRLYQEYMDMLGLWPIPEKTPLHATVTGQLEAHGVVVEKLHFQSKPGLYVTANYYRPKQVIGKLPAIVYVCGHSGRGRDGNKTAFQDHGFWFANNGYTCLILDTLQLGEIAGIHHGTYGIRGTGAGEAPTRFWWHSAGYTPAGVECWNGVRAIDYLLTRPEVDPQRIGVTGISGGGAATFWIAAADERVKVAVPISGMSDLEFYVKQKGVNGHCDCMFLYNTYQWDWTTIAALVAPRPMLFANSDNDPIFPMDANRRIMAKLRTCYKMYSRPPGESPAGNPDGALRVLDEYVSVGGHAYRPDLRIAIFKFLNKHLKGDTSTPVEDSARYTELPGKDLRVFPTDADVPKDAFNARIDETFVPRAKVTLPKSGKFAEWKRELVTRLQTHAFRALPKTVPAGRMVENNIVSFVSPEDGLIVTTAGLSVSGADAKLPVRLLHVWDAGYFNSATERPEKKLEAFFKQDAFKNGGFMLCPRGTRFLSGDKILSPLNWTTKSPPNHIERAHALIGRTIDEGRIQDVIATYKVWDSVLDKDKAPKMAWTLTGHQRSSVIAAYAALYEPSIKEVIVINPPKSHKEGPHFLGVLRVLDIPEALGLLAPTPLTIIGGNDPAFDRTAEIYRLAGAADKFKRK